MNQIFVEAKNYEADKKSNEVKEYCEHVDVLIEQNNREIKASLTCGCLFKPSFTGLHLAAGQLPYYRMHKILSIYGNR
mgnify:CR=1 FL=1